MNLENYKLCLGPMSKNIVDSIIEYSNINDEYLILIPSRRQIEFDGGYSNNWTTKDFCNYVKDKSTNILLERDHGGPGQGLHDDDGLESLKEDCKYFDIIHIDPWKKYPKYEDGLNKTIECIKYCYNLNSNIFFEIGTEENIRYFDVNELDKLIIDLKNNLKEAIFNQIKFLVIQCGTSLCEGNNTGDFSEERLIAMVNLTKKYKLLSKEHNGDWVSKELLQRKYKLGLNSINIAPELGEIETKVVLNTIGDNSILFEKMYNLCLNSNKWKKWVSDDFDPERNKEKLILICGHYVFSNPDFYEISENINNFNEKVSDSIHNFLNNIYCKNRFSTKGWLLNINRIRNTNEGINGIRLHRAERIEEFPKDFLETFLKTIDNNDITNYPDTFPLIKKIAKINQCHVDNVFLCDGSASCIKTFYDCFVVEKSNVLISELCYPMHRIYAGLNGANIIKIPYNKLEIDYDKFLDFIDENIICICLANPNSPMGDVIEKRKLMSLFEKSNKLNIPFLLDEAYIDFSDHDSCSDLIYKYPNLVISRTMSKGYGLAGLRIGYMLASKEIMNLIFKFIPTYEITSISCKFGNYLLDNIDVVNTHVNKIKKERSKIKEICEEENIVSIIGDINTIHLKLNNIGLIMKYLQDKNIICRTRYFSNYDEPFLSMSLFPSMTETKFFKEILKLNNF